MPGADLAVWRINGFDFIDLLNKKILNTTFSIITEVNPQTIGRKKTQEYHNKRIKFFNKLSKHSHEIWHYLRKRIKCEHLIIIQQTNAMIKFFKAWHGVLRRYNIEYICLLVVE